MAKKVTSTVYARRLDKDGNVVEERTFNPGDTVPSAWEDAITNPKAYEDTPEAIPEPGSSQPSDDVEGFEPAEAPASKAKK